MVQFYTFFTSNIARDPPSKTSGNNLFHGKKLLNSLPSPIAIPGPNKHSGCLTSFPEGADRKFLQNPHLESGTRTKTLDIFAW